MVYFSEKNVQSFTKAQIKELGFKPQHWGTIIECYRRDVSTSALAVIYYHTEKKVFFTVPPMEPEIKTFKVIIAGTRTFNDYNLLCKKMDNLLKNQVNIEIVSGGAEGADALGERYAKEMGYKLKIFPADWDNLGKKAGFVRNEEMSRYANACAVFWDGMSKGSFSMIKLAKAKELKTAIIEYKKAAK